MEDFSIVPMSSQIDEARGELLACNEISKKSGLALTEKDMAQLVDARFKALDRTGRVDLPLRALQGIFARGVNFTRRNGARRG